MTQHGRSDASSSDTGPSAARPANSPPPHRSPPPCGPHDIRFSGELLRKGLHLLALVIPAGMYLIGSPWSLILLVPLASLAVGADLLRAKSDRFAAFIQTVFGGMMRPQEVPQRGSGAVLNGATCVLISAALLALLFPIELAAPSFASFMVGDAAAAIIGLRFGRTRWPGTTRTVEGSSAFALTAFLCFLPFGHISLPAAAAAALLGAAIEIPQWRVNDNIRVPLAMAAILMLWRM